MYNRIVPESTYLMGMLSDIQHSIQIGDLKLANQLLNNAKDVVDEHLSFKDEKGRHEYRAEHLERLYTKKKVKAKKIGKREASQLEIEAKKKEMKDLVYKVGKPGRGFSHAFLWARIGLSNGKSAEVLITPSADFENWASVEAALGGLGYVRTSWTVWD